MSIRLQSDTFQGTAVVPPLLALQKIRARITQLEAVKARLLAYHQDRLVEFDFHGGWDSAIDLARNKDEIAGLRFAERAIVESGG